MRANDHKLIKVVLYVRRSLDREAIAALLRQSDDFRLLAALGDEGDLLRTCVRFRPDAAILDASGPAGDSHRLANTLFHEVCARCVVLLVDEPVRWHERRVPRLPNAVYVSRDEPFAALAQAIVAILGMETVRNGGPFGSNHRAPAERPLKDSLVTRLTAREIEVLQLLAEGCTVRQCADKLDLAKSTVDNHKARLMKKLELHKTVDLVRVAVRHGLILP